MAVIGLCTGTTQDWQDTIGRLILIERELGVEVTDDGYYLIRMGNGKDDFFDLPIIVNNKRYEEILSLVSTSYDDVSDMYDKVTEMLADTETARDAAQESADNAKASEEAAKESEDNAKASEINAKTSEDTALIYKEDVEKMLEDAQSIVDGLNKEAINIELSVDMETGELLYTQGAREFRINETTGELEWRFAS